MQDDFLLDTYKSYKSKYQPLHKENTIKYFEELTKKSNVDIEANKKTCTKYYAVLENIKKLDKEVNNKKSIKALIIFLNILFLITGITFLVFGIKGSVHISMGIILFILSIAFLIFGIIYIKKKINAQVKNLKDKIAKFNDEANKLKNEAYAQMDPLNSLYDWNIASELFEKTIPLFQMDQYFDNNKYMYMREKYNLADVDEENVSTMYCQSGSILGNPFLLCKDYRQDWYQKRYTGSTIIYWTTTVKTKDGYKTQHHTQTLVASVYKEAPKYSFVTYLIYGNEAAPNLTFSRAPSNINKMDEQQIKKIVSNRTSKLNKKSKDATLKGKDYTKFGNDEFEAIFGGEDRDNEVEYRLLFTPLAQKNMLDLLKSKDPFGDDFYFDKEKMVNYIQSKHSQNTDYYSNPSRFIEFDYQKAKKKFIDYNMSYFEGLYFDFAPLMSIPLYQQHKSTEYIYGKKFDTNICPYEHEVMANSLNSDDLKPSEACTPTILKTDFIKKNGPLDEVKITSHAFKAERRVTYVPKLGGDGRTHLVPVYWLEYIPIEKVNYMAIENKNSSRSEFLNKKYSNQAFNDFMHRISNNEVYTYERGLFATLITSSLAIDKVNELNKLYSSATSDVKFSTDDIIKRISKELNELDKLDNSNLDNDEAKKILDDEKQETKEVNVENIITELPDENPEENKKEKEEKEN